MKVPLLYVMSKVDVAVTVTVVSLEVIVLFPFIREDAIDENGFEIEVEVVVIVSEEELEEVVLFDVVVARAGMVTDPRSETGTTVSVVAAAISVDASVVVPSSTCTSTTEAVTVTCGARGRSCAAPTLSGKTCRSELYGRLRFRKSASGIVLVGSALGCGLASLTRLAGRSMAAKPLDSPGRSGRGCATLRYGQQLVLIKVIRDEKSVSMVSGCARLTRC